jgi:hypothetical protein
MRLPFGIQEMFVAKREERSRAIFRPHVLLTEPLARAQYVLVRQHRLQIAE